MQIQDAVPREVRQRQQNLPRDVVLEPQPADRGTSTQEKPDDVKVDEAPYFLALEFSAVPGNLCTHLGFSVQMLC